MMRRIGELGFVAFAIFIVAVIVRANQGASMDWLGWIPRLPYFDKLGHFILMGILSFLAVVALVPRMKGDRKRAAQRVVLVLLVLIAGEEVSQIFYESRTFSLVDFLCGAVGAVICGWVGYRLVVKNQ
ncbi:MAG: VanZ family protein [Verrucomicrobiaceae bacterium]